MTQEKKNKIVALVLMGIGVLALVFAVVCFSTTLDVGWGASVTKETYGGDAYTGIQNAAAQTAINVRQLAMMVYYSLEALTNVAGYAFVITGLAFLVLGWSKLPAKAACKESVVIEELPEL